MIALLRKLKNSCDYQPRYLRDILLCRRRGNTLIVRGYVFDKLGTMFSWTINHRVKNKQLLRDWLGIVSSEVRINGLLFGEENPTEEILERLYHKTIEKDPFVSHLWRDGPQVGLLVRESNAEFRLPF